MIFKGNTKPIIRVLVESMGPEEAHEKYAGFVVYHDADLSNSIAKGTRWAFAKAVAKDSESDDESEKKESDNQTKALSGEEFQIFTRVEGKFPLKAFENALEEKDVVQVLGQLSASEVKALMPLQEAMKSFLQRGGTLALDTASAPLFGQHFLRRLEINDTVEFVSALGFNIIPECCFSPLTGVKPKKMELLLDQLSNHERTYGIHIGPETLLRLKGRKFDCILGEATFVLPKRGEWEERIEVLKTRKDAGRNFESAMFDMTQWRRMAIDRSLDMFPPAKPPTPHVANGTLFIVGGGGTPRGMMDKMVELAGGKDAKMVYVPCSESEDVGERHSIVAAWKRMGVKSATFIHTKDRNEANDDESFYEPLKDATGIWFGGGRQWNFSDSYYGTKTHELMKDVLARGGVIGGSSAGASIQGRYLARATPVGNTRIMAPGYERGGLGFLGGVAIDQHFSQRGRQKDMTQLVRKYPQMLGIGIDESTAIMVTKSQAQVMGRGKVFFFNNRSGDDKEKMNDEGKDYVSIPAGAIYDLAARKVVSGGVDLEKAGAGGPSGRGKDNPMP